MIFTIVSIGGVIVALSQMDSLDDLKAFMVSNVVVTGSSIVAARLAGSAAVGFVVGMVLTMDSDQGPGTKRRMAESSLVAAFLRRNFTPEQIAAGGKELESQAQKLLFDTEPGLVVLPRVERTPVGRLAATAIKELAGDRSRKILLSTFLNAKKLDALTEFGDILRTRLHPQHGNFLTFYLATVEDQWSKKVGAFVAKSFVDAGVLQMPKP